MMDQKVLIIDMNLNRSFAKVTKPIFYDEEGLKQK